MNHFPTRPSVRVGADTSTVPGKTPTSVRGVRNDDRAGHPDSVGIAQLNVGTRRNRSVS